MGPINISVMMLVVVK